MQKKVIMKSNDAKDCGVCSMYSIIRHYDGFVSLETIRDDTKTNRMGTSAFHIIEAFKKYGFDAYGTKIAKEKFLESDFPMPAIVHVVLENGLNHFMVLYEKNNNKVLLMDPSSGKKWLDVEDFLWIWSEVILIVYPKEQILTLEKNTSFFKQIFFSLEKEKKMFLKLIWGNIILFILTVAFSFFLKITLGYSFHPLFQKVLVGFFGMILFLKLVLEKTQVNGFIEFRKKLAIKESYSFFNHLVSIPLRKYVSRNTSDYFTRFWETYSFKSFFTDVLSTTLTEFVWFVISCIILFFLNPHFLSLILFVCTIYLFLFFPLQHKAIKSEQMLIEEKTNFNENLLEHLHLVKSNHYLNTSESFLQVIEENLIQYARADLKAEKVISSYHYYKNALKSILEFCMNCYAIYLIMNQKLELIEFMLIIVIINYILSSFDRIMLLIPKWGYYKDLFQKSLDLKNISEESTKGLQEFQNGTITFQNISFTYNDYHYILYDFNLTIAKNSHILLVGKSGCGKSTLCKILNRSLELQQGNILIGDKNLLDINLNTIKNKIGYLSQKESLFSGTIKENILFYRPYMENRFIKVCEICDLEDVVKNKPLRYETTITSNENNLSGGERQRILLARLLLSNKEIYMLDEALSEVDEGLEKEIIKKMRLYLKEKTIIYVSHRSYKNFFDETIKIKECHERVSI